MLARRAKGAFVCLHCELHALQPRLRLAPATTPVARARFHASPFRRSDDFELAKLEAAAQDQTRPSEQHDQRSQEDQHSPRGQSGRGRGRDRDRGQGQRRQHDQRDQFDQFDQHDQQEAYTPRPWKPPASRRRAVLSNMTSLGAEANILVLGEVAQRKAQRDPEPSANAAPIEAPSLLKSLQQTSLPVSPSEISSQIDSLRPTEPNSPSEPHRLTRRAFVKLTRSLIQGFTVRQLSDYYSAAKNLTGQRQRNRLHRHLADAIKPQGPDNTGLVARTPWQPSNGAKNAPMNVRLPGLDTLHQSSRIPPTKESLADGIVRGIWRIELLEEVEGIGHIELSLRPGQLQLLLNPGRDKAMLDTVSRTRNVQIQVHDAHNVVRITADKNAAEYAANDIEDAVRNATSLFFSFTGWTAPTNDHPVEPLTTKTRVNDVGRVLEQKCIDYVSQLTRTCITWIPERDGLQIQGLNRPSIVEAEQYIMSLLPARHPPKQTYDTSKIDVDTNACYLVPTIHEPQSLAYPYRDMALGRWSLPTPRTRESSAASELAELESLAANTKSASAFGHKGSTKQYEDLLDRQVNRVVTELQQLDTPLFSTETNSPWFPEPDVNLTADFGQAVFPLANPDPKSIATVSDTSGRELPFHPTVPALAGFLATSDAKFVRRSEIPALVYDYVPSPKQRDFHPDQQLPSLRIQMRTTRDHGVSLHKLTIGFPWLDRAHSVLLPDKAIDIRFRQEQRLSYKPKTHGDPHVHRWIEAVRANIASGERLTAEPLQLAIPQWAIPGQPVTSELIPIKFLFTGVHSRQSATGRFGDAHVSYHTRQSGNIGATGGILGAYPDSSNNSSHQDKDHLTAFVKSCFNIVDQITQASTSRKPIPRVQQPQSDVQTPRNIQDDGTLQSAAFVQQDVQDQVLPNSEEGSVEADLGAAQEQSTANLEAKQDHDLEAILNQAYAEADDAGLIQHTESQSVSEEQESSAVDGLEESVETTEPTEPTVPTESSSSTDTASLSEDVQNQPKP